MVSAGRRVRTTRRALHAAAARAAGPADEDEAEHGVADRARPVVLRAFSRAEERENADRAPVGVARVPKPEDAAAGRGEHEQRELEDAEVPQPVDHDQDLDQDQSAVEAVQRRRLVRQPAEPILERAGEDGEDWNRDEREEARRAQGDRLGGTKTRRCKRTRVRARPSRRTQPRRNDPRGSRAARSRRQAPSALPRRTERRRSTILRGSRPPRLVTRPADGVTPVERVCAG